MPLTLTIPDKMKPQEIAIPGEPDPIPTQAILLDTIHQHYKPPSVKDCPEDSTETKVEPHNAKSLHRQNSRGRKTGLYANHSFRWF
jgi:hypothetical protein